MAYIDKRYYLKNVIEVEEYHTARYGAPGEKRGKKKKPTPEQIERQNQYNKEKVARRKLREHFEVNDYFTCLTYEREARPPDMQTAVKQFASFIRKLRTAYRKRGHELKWIRNIEVGTKGAWHIHLIVNRIPDTDVLLASFWQHGKVYNELMYQKGDFRELAAYITKTPKTDKRLKESNYSTSKNLPLPEPVKKIRLRWRTWGKVRIPRGYYLEPDSLVEGENPKTGYHYRHYTLIRLDRTKGG